MFSEAVTAPSLKLWKFIICNTKCIMFDTQFIMISQRIDRKQHPWAPMENPAPMNM